MRDLGTIDGYDYNAGEAINASGQIAGTSGYSSTPGAVAFVWLNNGTPLRSLGVLPGGASSYACCINASGRVAGDSNTQANTRTKAFLWKNDGTPIQSLGTLGGAESFASALNDAGQVTGYSTTVRFLKPHAFVWLNNGQPMKNLGTLGGTTSVGNDINASGEVTGYSRLAGDSVSHAFLWRNDGTNMQDLNALIDTTDPLRAHITLTSGVFINVAGDIAATGVDDRTGMQGVYLLQGTVLTLSPRSLAFGNQAVGTTSAARPVTVTNTGSRAAPITSIARDRNRLQPVSLHQQLRRITGGTRHVHDPSDVQADHEGRQVRLPEREWRWRRSAFGEPERHRHLKIAAGSNRIQRAMARARHCCPTIKSPRRKLLGLLFYGHAFAAVPNRANYVMPTVLATCRRPTDYLEAHIESRFGVRSVHQKA